MIGLDAILGAGKQGLKNIAAGKSQASLGVQSPHLAGAAVRLGRFFYMTAAGVVGITWYTGYVNLRLPGNESWTDKVLLPGASLLPVISTPDRPDKALPGGAGSKINVPTVPTQVPGSKNGAMSGAAPNPQGRKLVALSPQQLGVPGTAVAGYLWSAPSGEKQLPPYNAQRYRELVASASQYAQQFGLKITSGYRPGSTTSLHGHGLAFDMVGSMSNMKRAAVNASKSPGVFQEIFVHNEGSGMHLHLGYYPDGARILSSKANRYNRSGLTQSPAPAASRQSPIRA